MASICAMDFVSFGDTYGDGIAGAARKAAKLIAKTKSAVDQIGQDCRIRACRQKTEKTRAVAEVTGHDGGIWFSNVGTPAVNLCGLFSRANQIRHEKRRPDDRTSGLASPTMRTSDSRGHSGLSKARPISKQSLARPRGAGNLDTVGTTAKAMGNARDHRRSIFPGAGPSPDSRHLRQGRSRIGAIQRHPATDGGRTDDGAQECRQHRSGVAQVDQQAARRGARDAGNDA